MHLTFTYPNSLQKATFSPTHTSLNSYLLQNVCGGILYQLPQVSASTSLLLYFSTSPFLLLLLLLSFSLSLPQSRAHTSISDQAQRTAVDTQCCIMLPSARGVSGKGFGLRKTSYIKGSLNTRTDPAQAQSTRARSSRDSRTAALWRRTDMAGSFMSGSLAITHRP